MDGDAEWWQDAAVLQIYPRSFADGDGDGVGDLAGLIARLPYIAALGVDGIWMTPFQPSPQVDQGYDVTDYCGVDPLFGDHGAVRVAARARPTRWACGSCSTSSPTTAPRSTRCSRRPSRPARARRSGTCSTSPTGPRTRRRREPPEQLAERLRRPGLEPRQPDSGRTRTGTCTCSRPEQPDWNWRNPRRRRLLRRRAALLVRQGRGRAAHRRRACAVQGRRAAGLARPTGGVVDGLRSNPQVSDQEDVHEVYRRWRTLAEKYEPHRLLVGEVNLDPARAARYTRPGRDAPGLRVRAS